MADNETLSYVWQFKATADGPWFDYHKPQADYAQVLKWEPPIRPRQLVRIFQRREVIEVMSVPCTSTPPGEADT